MYSNSPTAMQNSRKFQEPSPCSGVGKGRGWESLFLFSENVLTLSYGVGNAEFKKKSGGNTFGSPFQGRGRGR